jgi:hypothetical protein
MLLQKLSLILLLFLMDPISFSAMNSTDLVYHRLYNQLVSYQCYHKPEEVVNWMGAMQAQDYYACLLAIGLRISTSIVVNQKVIEQAILDRKIVRTWPMRGTLHFVAAQDVHWMLNLLTPRVIRSSAGRYRQLDLDDAVLSKSRKIIEQALEGGKHLTRNELYTILETEGINTSNQRGIHIISHLAKTSIICLGPPREKQPTYVLLEEWITPGKTMEKDEALAKLAHRYYNSHGPATVYDFAAWVGLTVSEARLGIELNEFIFEKTKIEGKDFWFLERKEKLDFNEISDGVWLLPAFDEMLCGYKDKSALLSLENVKSIILRNGIIRPIFVLDNRAVGTWKWSQDKEEVEVDTIFSNPLTDKQKNIIKAKAKKLESFFTSKN